MVAFRRLVASANAGMRRLENEGKMPVSMLASPWHVLRTNNDSFEVRTDERCPVRTALIVVDVQRAFDQWDPAGKRRNNPLAVARIVDLLDAFRACGRRSLHSPRGHAFESSFLPDGTAIPQGRGARTRGRAGDCQRVNSAFIGTDLEAPAARRGHQGAGDLRRDHKHCVKSRSAATGLGLPT